MKYTVAINWDIDLLDAIDYPEVHTVFAGLPNTPLSGGRSSVMINKMDEDSVRKYINKVHDKGWSFDYNVNALCTENKELDRAVYVIVSCESFVVNCKLLVVSCGLLVVVSEFLSNEVGVMSIAVT